MRRLVPVLLFAIFACGFGGSATAGHFLCNNTSADVSAAVGWREGEGWNSRGWFNIRPRECALTIAGDLSNRYVYYYARGNGVEYKGGADGVHFCAASNEGFYYKLKTDPPNCNKYKFHKKLVGSSGRLITTLVDRGLDPRTAAAACSEQIAGGRDAFVRCWTRKVATRQQRRILNCVNTEGSPAAVAVCGAKGELDSQSRRRLECAVKYSNDNIPSNFVRCIAADRFSEADAKLINCVARNRGANSAMAACAAGAQLTAEQQRIYGCVANNAADYRKAGLCLASNQLSPDQRRLADCAMKNRGSYVQLGLCAAGDKLTPEQQVFLQCAATTGGEPYTMAACVGGQLTVNELDKCISQGIGGDGCFGDSNTAVKVVQNAWRDVTRGPGPSNDLLGKDGLAAKSLRNAASDLTRGPGNTNDLVGSQGYVAKSVGNAANDVTKGPSSSNDIVGQDGWVCQNLFGGC